MKKRKKSWIKENYRQTWKYIKESRNYIYFAFFLFLASALIGFFFPVFFSDMLNQFFQKIMQELQGKNLFQTIIFIILNNLGVAFFSLMLGVLFFVPAVIDFVNGYVLGFVAAKSVSLAGLGVLWKLVPHGIFEFPALIISLALGIKFGIEIIRGKFYYVRNLLWISEHPKNPYKESFYDNLENILRVFLFVILPLLIIAGIIEGSLVFLLK